jgi:multimeric flavodoxin WrbA
MKVLVINVSANKERSTTLKLTKTFLEGLDVEASEVEFVTTIGLNINPSIPPCSLPKHSSRP